MSFSYFSDFSLSSCLSLSLCLPLPLPLYLLTILLGAFARLRAVASATVGVAMEFPLHDDVNAIGRQIAVRLHNDAMALVGTVTPMKVFVEEEPPVCDPRHQDTHGEEQEGRQGFPHLTREEKHTR